MKRSGVYTRTFASKVIREHNKVLKAWLHAPFSILRFRGVLDNAFWSYKTRVLGHLVKSAFEGGYISFVFEVSWTMPFRATKAVFWDTLQNQPLRGATSPLCHVFTKMSKLTKVVVANVVALEVNTAPCQLQASQTLTCVDPDIIPQQDYLACLKRQKKLRLKNFNSAFNSV